MKNTLLSLAVMMAVSVLVLCSSAQTPTSRLQFSMHELSREEASASYPDAPFQRTFSTPGNSCTVALEEDGDLSLIATTVNGHEQWLMQAIRIQHFADGHTYRFQQFWEPSLIIEDCPIPRLDIP